MTRIGVYLDSGSEQYTVKNWFTTTLDGKRYAPYKVTWSILTLKLCNWINANTSLGFRYVYTSY